MKRFRTKKGITLIEVAAGLAILAMSMLFFSRMMADSASSAQAAADAKKLNMMARAAQTYINVEKADLEAFLTSPTQVAAIPLARNSETDLPPNGPHATLPSVQGAGLLASGFVDTNALGQRHALLVREPAAGQLEGMVVAYGGTQMSDAQLGKVVQSLGIAGGGVFAKDVQPITATPVANANISGFAGGWVTPVASWNNFNIDGATQTFAAGRPAISISMMDVVDGAGGGDEPPAEEEGNQYPTVGEALLASGYGKPNGLDEWPSAFVCLKNNNLLLFKYGGMSSSLLNYSNPAAAVVFESNGNGWSAFAQSRCDGNLTMQQICGNGTCEYMPYNKVSPKRKTIGQILFSFGYGKPNGVGEWPFAITCLKGGSFQRLEFTAVSSGLLTYSNSAAAVVFEPNGNGWSAFAQSRCDGNLTMQQICGSGTCEFQPPK